jgi:uncharacterized protein (TIGR03083 family)
MCEVDRMTESRDGRWPARIAADLPHLFALERSRLLDLLADIEAEDWLLSTPCPGWSVLGLCCHLLGDDLGWLARQRDGHHGTVPPMLDALGFAAWLDRVQDEWVQATRRLSPRLVVGLLEWTGSQVVEAMGKQDPSAPHGSVSWASSEPVPVWLDQIREVSEQWIHRQQLRQALDLPTDLRADLAAPVLDGLRWAYPHQLAAVNAAAGATVTVAIRGPLERSWHFVNTSGGWRDRAEPASPTIAVLDLESEQAWRLLTNNLAEEDQGQIRVDGDPAVVGILLRTRAMIGIPK